MQAPGSRDARLVSCLRALARNGAARNSRMRASEILDRVKSAKVREVRRAVGKSVQMPGCDGAAEHPCGTLIARVAAGRRVALIPSTLRIVACGMLPDALMARTVGRRARDKKSES